MDEDVSKFAVDIVNHVLLLHLPGKNRVVSAHDSTIISPSVLYNELGKYQVEYYFKQHQKNIKIFCSTAFTSKKIIRSTFCKQVDSLIEASRRYDQCYEGFYILCIKLTLLGYVAMERGVAEALSCIIEKIKVLATEACIRGDLDENFDCMFNFACDLLSRVFQWSGCIVDLYWDSKRLSLDSNALDIFSLHAHDFNTFLSRHGNTIYNKFSCVGSNFEKMTREVFIFQIQDWCDACYGQLDELDAHLSFLNILETCMHISLLTLYAVSLSYTCSIRIAHEYIVKLAISAEKHGVFTSTLHKKLKIKNLEDF